MGEPARKIERATYADLVAVPAPRVAELVGGTLYTFPRPAPKHGAAESNLGAKLIGPFGFGQGGPGGWRILIEPELHFPDPTADKGVNVVAPDLAGWRRERMPKLPKTKYFALAPDWVCEVLSPSTEAYDRTVKMPLFAREGVAHAWLVDPIVRTLEVYQLTAERQWLLLAAHRDDAVVRAAPFDAVDLQLGLLWEESEDDVQEHELDE